MAVPTDGEQIEFLAQVQRLLSEGQFTSTYKYALLHALADLAVERGGDDGAPLTVSCMDLAEKFVEYYWRQAAPYVVPGDTQGRVLLQNTDRQAAIIRAIEEARAKTPVLGRLRQSKREWRALVSKVAKTISAMPLWKLQRVGDQALEVFYENVGKGSSIAIKPTAVFCLRRFHSLVVDLVQAAWLRFVRRLHENQPALGQVTDMAEFLFGSERANLAGYASVLDRIQDGRCFYCADALRDRGAVDHFIPWSRYSLDLGHNFVLAHGSCNTSKSDRIAAYPHLERWSERNDRRRDDLAHEFDVGGLQHDLGASIQVARWTYQQVDLTGGRVWIRKDDLVTLDPAWRKLLVSA